MFYQIPTEQFDSLARGYGETSIVQSLFEAQRGKRILLLYGLIEKFNPESSLFDLVCEIDTQNSAAFTATLLYPQVGNWIAHCMNDATAFGYIHNILASAAVRAEYSCEMSVAISDQGTVFLPGLGMAIGLSGDNAIVRVTESGAEIIAGSQRVVLPGDLSHDNNGWRALRKLRSTFEGYTIEVFLDDLDPYRDEHDLHAQSRLSAEDFANWQQAMDEGWVILLQHFPQHALTIAMGLMSIVPLDLNGPGKGASATISTALGSICMTEPPDGAGMVLSLLHEFNHVKFGLMLDVVSLIEPDDGSLHYAPWRGDPRPLEGLFNGTYAHLGVTEFWGVMRTLATTPTGSVNNQDVAEVEFVRWREQVARAIKTIQASGLLTQTGERFLTGMREGIERWLDEPVDSARMQLAHDAATDHEAGWRLRNLRPHEACIARMAEAWLAGNACPNDVCGDSKVVSASAILEISPRHTSDDYAQPIEGYLQTIASNEDDSHTWAGLVIASSHTTTPDSENILTEYPEIVYALYRELRPEIKRLSESDGSLQLDPIQLGTWAEIQKSVHHQ